MRGILPRILLLAVPVVAGCGSSDSPTSSGPGFLSNSDCTLHTHLSVSVQAPAPPPVQLRIESCRLDVDACNDLCTYELNHLAQYPQWLGGVQVPPVFNTGIGAAPGVPAGSPPINQFSPSLCKVTFDGSTANAEIAVDTPNFGAGCPQPDVGTAGVGAGGAPSGGL